MEELILARHGESEFSARERVSGDPSVACPLTGTGEEQARRLGELLADEEIDLCVVTEFERTQQTADLALAGRDVPRLVLAELNDPRAGRFEGARFSDFREWRLAHGPLADPPGGGESSAAIARRLARGLGKLLERPERRILLVGHSLPIAYVLGAAEGRNPAAELPMLGHGEPHRLTAAELERAVERLERWTRAPSFEPA